MTSVFLVMLSVGHYPSTGTVIPEAVTNVYRIPTSFSHYSTTVGCVAICVSCSEFLSRCSLVYREN